MYVDDTKESGNASTDEVVDVAYADASVSNAYISDHEDALGDVDESDILNGKSQLIEQRALLNGLLETQMQSVTEGTLVNVIYSSWIMEFLNGDFETTDQVREKLGPIDTNGIINDNGIFCDFNAYPLYVLVPEIYEKLVEWYGLAPNSKGVTTYVISRPDGSLEPEFAKPSFYLHHLVTEPIGAAYSTAYSSIPLFAISSLQTFEDLVQMSIQKLDEKEKLSKYHKNQFTSKKFRLWILTDDDLISLSYSVTPKQFIKFKHKILLKKQFLSGQIKSSGLNHAHLIIEEKQIINSKRRKSSENFWPSNFFIHHPPSPSDGRIGLQNLGNTCYMNSALQCLVHIPELTQYFLFNCYEKELNPDNPLGMNGKIASSFANLIHNLFDKKSKRGTSLTPREFKQTIGHFNSMFAGYHQQDSQEFLAFLLDGLHEDLNRIIKKPITEKPEINENDFDNQDAIRQLAQKSWEQHKLRNDSIVIDLFTGLYKSTLVCPDCSKISITFDPFSDLTLPLPINNAWSKKITLFLENGPIKTFEVELTKNSTYKTLKNYVAQKLSLDPNNLFTCEIWSDQFYKNFESAGSKSGYLPISDLISNDDVIVMYEVHHSKDDTIVPVLNTVLPESGIPCAFGLPFFIALNESEKNSFAAIRKKLEHRYEQLSTYQYFSNVRSSESKESTKSDIDMKDCKEDEQDVDIVSDRDGYDSDGSLDEYAFKVKVFDASKSTKVRRKNYNYASFKSNLPSRYGPANHHQEEQDEKVWTPNTNNSFTKLPELLNSLDPKKVALNASKAEASSKESDAEETENVGAQAEKENAIEIEDDLKDYVQVSPVEDVQNISDSTDSLDAELTVLTDTLEEEKLGDSIKLSDKESPTERSAAISKELIGKRTALVCEWDPELFDVFFSGLEDEGQGGNNTWSNPEIIVNEEVEESKRQREAQSTNDLTLDRCLRLFSKPEVLGEQDLWYCSNCKEHRQATKQIEIWSTPDILSIHLKRFENQRSFSDKIDAVVDFPIEGLDMSPYLATTIKSEDDCIYDLFAVDNHFGGLGGGHYTSYVKNFVDNQWYYYDDSRVTVSSPEKAIAPAAYLLFYRKRSHKFLGGDNLVETLEKARESFEEQQKLEVENLENFYRENKESSSEEEDEPEEAEAEAENDDGDDEGIEAGDRNTHLPHRVAYGVAPSPRKITESDDESNSSDNVSSIPVGSDDEETNFSSRRKQRLISRGSRYSRLAGVSAINSDIDSPLPVSSNSTPSEDGSTYSPPVNIPGAYPSPNPTSSPK